ncbi:MAG: hypothetical protein ACP5G2_05090 [Candidatus Bipolaricaulaceae bacterium]
MAVRPDTATGQAGEDSMLAKQEHDFLYGWISCQQGKALAAGRGVDSDRGLVAVRARVPGA